VEGVEGFELGLECARWLLRANGLGLRVHPEGEEVEMCEIRHCDGEFLVSFPLEMPYYEFL